MRRKLLAYWHLFLFSDTSSKSTLKVCYSLLSLCAYIHIVIDVDNYIGNDGARNIALALETSIFLQAINLQSMSYDICILFHSYDSNSEYNSPLLSLGIDIIIYLNTGNNIGYEGALRIAQALETCTSLQEINFRSMLLRCILFHSCNSNYEYN